MRYYLDTEFHEPTLDLISIGVVDENGRDFYAINKDAVEICQRSSWLEENVLPHLGKHHGNVAGAHLDVIATSLRRFTKGTNPEWWGYYSAHDWVILCRLMGGFMHMPPNWGMLCRDIAQEANRTNRRIELPESFQPEHHALVDARWTKAAHEHILHEAKE